MDFNAHVGNTRFLDRCSDIRMMYFEDNGFDVGEFRRRGIGPVVMSDTLQYFREVNLGDTMRVTLRVAGLAEDASRFRFRNDIYVADKLAASVTSSGGFMDLNARKIVMPPADLASLISALDHTEDFEQLPSSTRR